MVDVIVIGAGLGGLAAGAKLAREGLRVLVLEQHDRPGGCASVFRRKEFTFEVGLHEMDGPVPGETKDRIFRELGIYDRVTFLELPQFYRYTNGRVDLTISHDPEETIRTLSDAFPKETRSIEDYFGQLRNHRRIRAGHRGKRERSIGEFLDETFESEDLKLALLGNLSYYHDDPYSLSWLYFLSAQGSYFRNRASYIRGGSGQLARALSDVITESGGEVRLNSLVRSIDYDGKKPAGVTWTDSRGPEKETCSEKAGQLVVNAAVPRLAEEWLGGKDRKRLRKALNGEQRGISLLTVYFGFREPLFRSGNPAYSTFVQDPSVEHLSDIRANNRGSYMQRGFTLVDYSHVDARLAPAGKSTAAVCAVDSASGWENLDREEYVRLKADVADAFTERCESLIPGFRDIMAVSELATPLTVERYTLNPGGSVYGFAQLPDRSPDYLSALPPNLHIASAWGRYGGGYTGTILAGYHAATDILRSLR